jgi:hypothetical protein
MAKPKLVTLPPSVDRNVKVNLDKLASHAGDLDAQVQAIAARIATQPPPLTLTQIQQALGSGGSNPLNVTGLIGTVPVKAIAPPTTTSPPATTPSPPLIPPPTPPAPTGPPTTGTFAATDMLNLASVTVLSSPADIATWAQTATLSLFDFQTTGVQVTFDKQSGAGRWPDQHDPTLAPSDTLQYTLWLFLQIGGTWYGAALIQYWFGLARNGGPPSQMAVNWTGGNKSLWSPMGANQPAVGVNVGFMVSAGNGRNNAGAPFTIKERSQTILIPMPSDNGCIFT